MKRYYAGESQHGSITSHGFGNDWVVYVFNNKLDRDKFVRERLNLSTIAIARKDVTKHAANWSMTHNCYYQPKPFSGEYWGIEPWEPEFNGDIPGCIGTISVCYPEDNNEPFYK